MYMATVQHSLHEYQMQARIVTYGIQYNTRGLACVLQVKTRWNKIDIAHAYNLIRSISTPIGYLMSDSKYFECNYAFNYIQTVLLVIFTINRYY